jgi:ADP-L-glycero-D-manno-heptose 6-epimerase
MQATQGVNRPDQKGTNVIIVTGGAGFIGSCIVARLNARGREDLIIVDHLNDPLKEKNLENKKYARYYDKAEFLSLLKDNRLKEPVECLIHMGACSSTTLTDAAYYRENNLEYSQTLALWALEHDVKFIYASSAATYGDGSCGYMDDEETIRRCKPLNLYGQSKQDFDLWALDNGYLDTFVGLKFFNVFGPNEYHKKDMRSVVLKAYPRVAQEGKMALFKSYKSEYGHGEQKRDFIYVTDAVSVVMFFFDHTDIGGIFNVGTGQASTWNDLARALFRAVGKEPCIEYIEMPEHLREKYQYFTQAEMMKLVNVGYLKPFRSLNDTVSDYVGYLKDNRHL